MAWDVCIEIPAIPDPVELMLPGGISLKHTNLEELVQPALAPLGPAFKLLDAVTTLVEVIQSIGDAIAPPNPTKIAEALARLAQVPPALATLMPPVAIPRMLTTCIDLILRSLGEIRSELINLQQQMASLLTTADLGHKLNDGRLLSVFACAQHNVEQEVANLGKSMASVGHLLNLVALFGKLAGLNLQVPNLDAVAGRPLDEAIAPIDQLIAALGEIRQVMP